MRIHMLRRRTLLALVLVGLVALAVPAFAKGKPTSASITVVGVNPHADYGDVVTVESTDGGKVNAFANISCYQDIGIVYTEWKHTGTATFTLGPTQRWESGDATCKATVQYLHKNGSWRTIASYSFTAVDG